ncbi:hypothetical protein ScPMuIL_010086 [Solemya velum]
MHVFARTYETIQSTIDHLNGQVKVLKRVLDETITQSCNGLGTSGQAPRYNVTICDFEDGVFCNYTQDKGDRSDWTLQKVADHTYGTTFGHVARSYTYTSRISSRHFDAAENYCIRFFYKPVTRAYQGQFRLYIKVDSGLGNPVFQTATAPANKWSFAEVSPDPEYLTKPFQITFESNANTPMEVDDITVYNVPCNYPGKRPPCATGTTNTTHQRVQGNYTSCYNFHINPQTWYEAVKACKREWPMSHLVSINNDTEQDYLLNLIDTTYGLPQAGEFGYWTSGNDEVTEGTWVWTGDDNQRIVYNDWHPGQPNDVGGHQDCLLMQYSANNYEWGDVDCTERHPFICEATFPSY